MAQALAPRVADRLAPGRPPAWNRRSGPIAKEIDRPDLYAAARRSALRRQRPDTERGADRADLLGAETAQCCASRSSRSDPKPPASTGATRRRARCAVWSAARSGARPCAGSTNAVKPWRGFGARSNLDYGAFFGTTYDRDGLYSSKVYYETGPGQIEALPPSLFGIVSTAMSLMPRLRAAVHDARGAARPGRPAADLRPPRPLRIADLQPVLDTLGLGAPHAGAAADPRAGARRALRPAGQRHAGRRSARSAEGPEFELYVLLGMIPDLPPNFLSCSRWA